MNALISRKAAIDAIYKNHMNGKEGVKQDVENLYGSAACFSETLQDAVESIEELPPVPAIPISVIEGMREEIQHIDDFEVVNGKLYIREFDAVGIIDRHIKEYKAESEE